MTVDKQEKPKLKIGQRWVFNAGHLEPKDKNCSSFVVEVINLETKLSKIVQVLYNPRECLKLETEFYILRPEFDCWYYLKDQDK